MNKLIFPTEPKWLKERTLLLGLTGSHAYGTNTPESDMDYRGVCIPPLSYYLGLDTFNEYNNTGGKSYKNSNTDVDLSIAHLSKFVRDATSGVPNNLELLFLRREDYVLITPIGEELINHRHLFLSKQVLRKFGGYAYSQMRRLEQGKGSAALIEQYGYDTKDYMHAVRLLTSAIEILETGDFSTYRPNREFLLACRSGQHSLKEALNTLNDYNTQLKEAGNHSMLPERPDYNKVNRLLMELNQEALFEQVFP